MYALSVETEGFEKGVDVLSEVTLRPVITDKQVSDLVSLFRIGKYCLHINCIAFCFCLS